MRAFSLIFLAAYAFAAEFTVCKNQRDNLGIHTVEFTPAPPVAGRDVSVTVKGSSQTDITAGTTIHVDVKLFGVVLSSEVFDACTVTACPILAGQEFTATVTQPIPKETPPHVAATVKMTVLSKGQVVSCLESIVQVEPAHDAAVLGATQHNLEFIFQKWKAMHPHILHAELSVFAANWERIAKHNADKTQTFTMAMNEFGAMTLEEFTRTRMGLLPPQDGARKGQVAPVHLRSSVAQADPPAEMDWTALGKVTPVKNQGSCGSCWAFSAIGAVESAFAIKTGRLLEFSEQELVSCDQVDQACNGGLMDNAFDWIEHNTAGLCSEEAYPYTSGQTGARGECLKATCEAVEGTVPSSFLDIAPNEQALLAAVATHGPVSVAIEADQAAFQFYHSGVMKGLCGSHLDHGVLLVGYGVDQASGLKFWKIKNSWGAGWGEQGYIRILRGKRWQHGGECGISSAASFPVFS